MWDYSKYLGFIRGGDLLAKSWFLSYLSPPSEMHVGIVLLEALREELCYLP